MRARITRRIVSYLLAAYAALIVAFLGSGVGSAAAQGSTGRTVVDRDLRVEAGETVQGNVEVTNGDLTVEAGATVQGTAHVFNGDADVYGTIQGDLTVLGDGDITLHEGSLVQGNVIGISNIKLSDNSRVEGNVTTIGGTIEQSSGASVTGMVSKLDNPAEGIGNFINGNSNPTPGTDQAGMEISPFARFFGWLSLGIFSTFVLVAAVGIASLVPRRIRIASTTLEAEPGPSIVVGIIAAVLTFPIAGIAMTALAITVVGIVLIPVLALAVLCIFMFGFVVVSQWLGKRLHESTRRDELVFNPRQSQPATLVIEVLLGAAVILASTVLPALFLPGWITAMLLGIVYVISSIGMGSLVLSKFGTLQPSRRHLHRHAVVYPTPVHNHYGSSLPHPPIQVQHANTQPLGPAPVLPREEPTGVRE